LHGINLSHETDVVKVWLHSNPESRREQEQMGGEGSALANGGLEVLQIGETDLVPTDLAVECNREWEVQQHIVVDGKAKHNTQEAVVSEALLIISVQQRVRTRPVVEPICSRLRMERLHHSNVVTS
jgi:hypothetical protein